MSSDAEVVETARGPVEFQRRGEAPYVLVLHGTPGGHVHSFLPRISSEKDLAQLHRRGPAICARQLKPALALMPPLMR